MAEKEKRLPLLLYAAILIVVGAAVLFAFLAVVLGIQPPEIPGSSEGSGSSPTENASSIAKENLLPYMPPMEAPAVKENEILVRFTIAFAVENTVKGEPLEGGKESMQIPLPAYAQPPPYYTDPTDRQCLNCYDLKFAVYYENKVELDNFRIHLVWENVWLGEMKIVEYGNVATLYGNRVKVPEIEIEKITSIWQRWLSIGLSEIYPGETLVIEGQSILLKSEENLKIAENLSLISLTNGNMGIVLNFVGGPAHIRARAVLGVFIDNSTFLLEKWIRNIEEAKTSMVVTALFPIDNRSQ